MSKKDYQQSPATHISQLVKPKPDPWPYPFPRNRKFRVIFGNKSRPRLVMDVYGENSSMVWERHAALRLENERMEVVAL